MTGGGGTAYAEGFIIATRVVRNSEWGAIFAEIRNSWLFATQGIAGAGTTSEARNAFVSDDAKLSPRAKDTGVFVSLIIGIVLIGTV